MSGTFLVSQKNWATLTKEEYTIYMTFKKVSYFLYDAKVIIKFHHAPLWRFLTAHIFNVKVKYCGTENASMGHIPFAHIKGRANILADYISRLRSMSLYDMLNPEERVKEQQIIHWNFSLDPKKY